MTATHLRPCPSCARHVRVNEGVCPFCRASLAGIFASDAAPLAPAARLSRAALFALSTGTIALTSACGGSTAQTTADGGGGTHSDDASSQDDASSDYDGPSGAPLYGGAPPDDAGVGNEKDAGGVAPAYGAPPVEAGVADAGADADAAAMPTPPYGIAPFDPDRRKPI